MCASSSASNASSSMMRCCGSMFSASSGLRPNISLSKDAMSLKYPPAVLSSSSLVRMRGSARYSDQRPSGRGPVVTWPSISSCQNSLTLSAPGKRPAVPTMAMSRVPGE